MILVVDDDNSVRTSVSLLLKQAGFEPRAAADPAEALRLIRGSKVELVIQDMNFSRDTSGAEGLALLDEIKQLRPDLPVILITAWGSINLAVQGIKRGASDFVTKPWSNQQLLQTVSTTLGLARTTGAEGGRQDGLSRAELDERYNFDRIIGQDPRFLKILEVIGRVSPTDASILITGESGTGKEVIAEAVHLNSPRRGGPFVKVNLGGISSTLFESEMFGHVRGAFTDAYQDRKGRFELADSGTIFLDEIGDLDLNAQVKLLRVLQDRTFEVLGTSNSRNLDVRVVSATNRNLSEMVEQGDFREDLLYRLNLISVNLPPLRERPDDIPLLVRQFLDDLSQVYRRGMVRVEEAAMKWLKSRPWPGNIRQLKQFIERTVLVTDKDVFSVKDFSIPNQVDQPGRTRETLPMAGSMTMEEIERAMIVKCLDAYGGNVSRVAEALGMSRAALYRRFEKYGLNP
jgi:DNA-binding NtrC family response regulator